jgi:hypothetical protein
MKIFISHKQEDSVTAKEVLETLKGFKVDAYLDLLEGEVALRGEALTNHIKKRLNDCTDLLVVMSEKTKNSWWVPFEVGMAAQRDFPIVNYLKATILLPDYLSYWPRLKNQIDLAKYIQVKNKLNQTILLEKSMGKFASAESQTARFYRELKVVL